MTTDEVEATIEPVGAPTPADAPAPPPDEHAGHDHSDHAAIFRRRFWISLALTVPVLIWSEMIQDWLGFTAPEFPGSTWIPAIFGTIVFVYGGRVFLEGGWWEIRHRQPGMMALIAMAITVGFGASIASAVGALDQEFWWELTLLIVVMLLGHWQEMRALGQARGALDALAELLPDEAEVVQEDDVVSVPASSLAVGNLVLVRPGGRVPADGLVEDGHADVDESMVTGESTPVARGPGSEVVAGTVVTDSALRVRVTATGDDTALAGIQRLVEEAQTAKSRAQALADRAAGFLFYVSLGAAAITASVWLAVGTPIEAINRTVTVLVVSCPHALGLAIPLVIALTTAVGAKQGILVKSRVGLETARTINAVMFDKTGTLTTGDHAVTGIASVTGNEDDLLRRAGAAEIESEHPLAQAIVTEARSRGALPRTEGFQNLPGRGVEATVAGQRVAVGGPALLRERGLELPNEIAGDVARWKERGAAVLAVVAGDEVVGALALEDQVRPESREAIEGLHQEGVQVAMVTGDAHQVADAVAEELGIDDVFAEVLPQNKDGKVAELQAVGRTVAMVGDGVNDAPALARADVGIAIGAGTDVAIDSADLVLASSDPRGVLKAIRLARASYRKMIQNLVWATGYNVVAIPLAAGILAPIGIVLPPAAGAALMSISTIVVALNAQLMRRVDLSKA